MAVEPKHIRADELIADPGAVMERVTRNREQIVVEQEGDIYILLKPIRRAAKRRRAKLGCDVEAFRRAAGSWRGIIDIDRLKADIAASRGSNRPPAVL
ncbi:MAG: hypothetical protein M1531_00445 [Chloroflexi bacterium]|nr:hypothetical protein [Chloroflexota bacterium]